MDTFFSGKAKLRAYAHDDNCARARQVSGHDLSVSPSACEGCEVVPKMQSYIEGPLGPVGLLLVAEISRAIRIVLRAVGETGFDGVIVNV